jgi:hypothetical protein
MSTASIDSAIWTRPEDEEAEGCCGKKEKPQAKFLIFEARRVIVFP